MHFKCDLYTADLWNLSSCVHGHFSILYSKLCMHDFYDFFLYIGFILLCSCSHIIYFDALMLHDFKISTCVYIKSSIQIFICDAYLTYLTVKMKFSFAYPLLQEYPFKSALVSECEFYLLEALVSFQHLLRLWLDLFTFQLKYWSHYSWFLKNCYNNGMDCL